MIINNIEEVAANNCWLDSEGLAKAFREYASRHWGMNYCYGCNRCFMLTEPWGAEIDDIRLTNPYGVAFILQDSYGTYQLKGESYEARLCLANGACFRGTPDKDAFPFIMLIRESTLTGQSVGEYLQAEKHYILL